METNHPISLCSEISDSGVALLQLKALPREELLNQMCKVPALEKTAGKIRALGSAAAPRTIICNLWNSPEMPFFNLGTQVARALAEGAAAASLAADSDTIICVNERDTVSAQNLTAAAGTASETGVLEVRILPDLMACRQENALLTALQGRSPVTRSRRDSDLSFKEGNAVVLEEREILNLYHWLNRTLPETEGAKVIRVIGDVCRPGIVQIDDAVTFRQILDNAGGIRDGAQVKYLQFGYPSGYLLAPDKLDTTVREITANGSPDDCFEVLRVYDDSRCIVDTLRETTDVLRRESCGCCVYCREGCKQMHAILEDLAAARGTQDDPGLLELLSNAAIDGALCDFGRGAGRVILGALEAFRPEIEAHLNKRCNASICKGFITYHILPRVCSGCGACAETCGQKAIAGKPGEIHVIDGFDCNKCGECVTACPENAIVRAGAVKPRTPKEPIPVGTWKGR